MKIHAFFKKKNYSWWQWLLIIAGVMLLLALILFIGRKMYWQGKYKDRVPYSYYWQYENTTPYAWLSSEITFRKADACDRCDGFLYNERTRKKVDYRTPALRWVEFSLDDSLAVGAIAGRRAYFNRFTGEQVLPFDYTRAWFFSEGVAAVTDTSDNLFFINPKGERVIGRFFRYSPAMRYEGYLFHSGNCIMTDSLGHYGLIDKNGDWSVEPQWTSIFWRDRYWELHDGERMTLLDSALRTLMPLRKASESRFMRHHVGESFILVEIPGKPSLSYSLDGKLQSDKVFERVEKLLYTLDGSDLSDEEEEDDPRVFESNCLMYSNRAGMCGLLSRQGAVLTDAVYYDIEAVGKNLFRARLDYSGYGSFVLLNEKGREIQ